MGELTEARAAADKLADPAGPEGERRAPEGGPVADGRDVDVVLRRLSRFWSAEPHPVPSWAAQELTFGQLRLLFQLQQNGGAAPVSRIAEWLGIGLPAASGVVDRVERHGFVERRHRRDDRRVVECHLTEPGNRLLTQIVGMRDEGMRRVLSLLTPAELADLDRLLAAVQERMAARRGRDDAPQTPAAPPPAEPTTESRSQ